MYGQPPTPPASSWLSTAAAAFNPAAPIAPAAAAAVPYGGTSPYAPVQYAPPPQYAPAQYAPPPSSSGRGEVYEGDAYDPDAAGSSGYEELARGGDASLYDGGELGDEDATAIDYDRHFSGAAGLSGWSDSLLSLAKGAASGALTTGAAILSKPKPPTAAELEAMKLQAAAAAEAAKKKAAGGIDTTTIAIAGGVGLLGLFLLTRKRGGAPAAAVVANPRRRRRRR